MRNTKDIPSNFHDEEILNRICPQCKMGILKRHHQYPTKYIKCETCGFTKEKLEKPTKIIGTGGSGKPDVN